MFPADLAEVVSELLKSFYRQIKELVRVGGCEEVLKGRARENYQNTRKRDLKNKIVMDAGLKREPVELHLGAVTWSSFFCEERV